MSVPEGKLDKFDYKASLKKDRKGFCARYLAFERWITRPMSAIVVRMVFPTRVTPNQLTVAAFVFSLSAAVLFAMASPLTSLLAAAAVQLSLILDCADGMLARAKNQCSRYGTYFDIFLDRISDFIVLLGAAAGLFRLNGSWTHLALSLLVIALYMLQVNLFYVFNLYSDSKSGESGEARALAIYFVTFCGIVHRLDWIFYALLAETALNLVYRVTHFLLQGKKAENPQT